MLSRQKIGLGEGEHSRLRKHVRRAGGTGGGGGGGGSEEAGWRTGGGNPEAATVKGCSGLEAS